MKRLIYVIFLVLPLLASSQNMYNLTDLFENNPSGTARFVGMGGAMGALGGDLSVMGTNPAGTAIYRSSDFNLTGMYDYVTNNATFKGTNTPASSDAWGLSSMGFILALEIDDSPVKYFNFGGNFRRKSSINSKFVMDGPSESFSQLYVINDLYKQNPFDIYNMNSEMYSGLGLNWLTLLAADAGITDADGNFLINPYDGLPVYIPTNFGYYSEQRGSLDVYDMNISANINDRFYVGATLGYHRLDYSRTSCYYEDDELGEIYSLNNDYRIIGTGYDFKLGVICRPFKYSPFRVALSMHTPVFYDLMDVSSASMYGPYGEGYRTNDAECYGDDFYTSYRFRTPWKFGAAMSYTFGRFLALDAEYEYSDATAASFTNGYDIDKQQNYEISCNMKPQHTLRVGAEFTIDKFAMRIGYNRITAPFSSEAYKCIDNSSIVDTSTEYFNKYDKDIATIGFGYAGKHLYFDVAYMYYMYNSDFYPYYDKEYANPVTKVQTEGHSVYAGIGVRF
ncbi:MAG: hypothetical protein IKY85_03025 [Bacteroidaceae bacterium]|nr:hypothetical protein [Bacteroidaceae bacterium]